MHRRGHNMEDTLSRAQGLFLLLADAYDEMAEAVSRAQSPETSFTHFRQQRQTAYNEGAKDAFRLVAKDIRLAIKDNLLGEE